MEFFIDNANQLTVATLALAFLGLTWRYFTMKEVKMEERMREILNESQQNVLKFIDTVNHNQTKINDAVHELSDNIKAQTEVFKELIRK